MYKVKYYISFFALVTLGIFLFVSPVSVFAQEDLQLPNASREFYVYDETNIINQDVSEYIINTNETLYAQTGAQVVVAVVNTIGERSIEEFSNQLYRKWQIGSAEENNGVLFLIVLDKKQMRLEIGYGLEGALPDGKVGQIRDEYIIPAFQKEEYNEGILGGFNEIISSVAQEYDNTNNSQQNKAEPEDKKANWLEFIKKVLMILGVFIFLIIDFTFFGGMLTLTVLSMVTRGGFNGGGGSNRGGGGSSGGGGASGGW